MGGEAVAVRLEADGKFLLAFGGQGLTFMFCPAAGQGGCGYGRSGNLHGVIIGRPAEIHGPGYFGGTVARFGVLQQDTITLGCGRGGIPSRGVCILLNKRIGHMNAVYIPIGIGISNIYLVSGGLYTMTLGSVNIAGNGRIVFQNDNIIVGCIVYYIVSAGIKNILSEGNAIQIICR